MVKTNSEHSTLGRMLVLDELFDLTLFQRLRPLASGDFALLLDELIAIEHRHLLFWKGCFGINDTTLDLRRRIKLRVLVFVCRIFGEHGMHLVVEAIEVFGIRKYLTLWTAHKDEELGTHIAGILRDELVHEDWIVSRYKTRTISPARVRSVFLGFNDGSVEILGVVAGFFIAFSEPSSVLIAGTTVAVAGSISMAAGSYAASNSESEVRAIEEHKASFLGMPERKDEETTDRPLSLAVVVGVSYFVGAIVPIIPVMFGAKSVMPSIVASGAAILCVSYVLAFLSGMDARRRMFMNLTIIIAAVLISSSIGYVVREVWGVAV